MKNLKFSTFSVQFVLNILSRTSAFVPPMHLLLSSALLMCCKQMTYGPYVSSQLKTLLFSILIPVQNVLSRTYAARSQTSHQTTTVAKSINLNTKGLDGIV